MRNPLLALKASCAILSTLLVIPCNSQVATFVNRQNMPVVSERTKGNNTSARTRVDNIDPIESARLMISVSLPIIERLSEQRRNANVEGDIENLITVMYFQINGRKYEYHELTQALRIKFEKTDFQQLYEILYSVDRTLSKIQRQRISESDVRYYSSMNQISDEIMRSNFMGRILPSMMIYAFNDNRYTPNSNNDPIISVFGNIGLIHPSDITIYPSNFNQEEVREVREVIIPTAPESDYNSRNPQIRIEAVRNMTSQTSLANVAYSDSDPYVRLAAIDRITVQSVLANIAYNDSNSLVRLAAVDKITVQSVLANVAYNDKDATVRMVAVRKITVQSVLANVAYNDNDANVRLTAIDKISVQSVLANVAYNDNDATIRMVAVRKISVQSVLANVAYNDNDANVRLAAMDKISVQSVLANIAYNDKDATVRLAAINRITVISVLRNISNNDSNEMLRQAAIRRLNSL